MARVTVYVPDEMRAEMETLGDRVNWSSIAQDAFAARIRRAKAMIDLSQMNVLERLRATKEKGREASRKAGREAGRDFATRFATYDELQGLASFKPKDGTPDDPSLFDQICQVLDAAVVDDGSLQELAETRLPAYIEPFGDHQNDQVLRGFVEGAVEAWDDLKDLI